MTLNEATLPVTAQTQHILPLEPQTEEDQNEKYRALHRHVLDYQAGKPGSAEIILNSFEKFLFKYYNFIVYGAWNMEDTSIRRFIACFSDIGMSKTAKYKYSPFVRDTLDTTAISVCKLLKVYEPDDVMQYLRLALLEMATRYKDYTSPNGSFHNYVHKNFHYYAVRMFPTKDPILFSDKVENFKNLKTTDANEKFFETYTKLERQIDHEIMISKSNDFVINEQGVDVYDDEALNLNWVNGITCSERFSELAPFERKILILSYLHGLRDDEIADEYGFCRATINRKKMTAIKKLSNAN